MPFALWRDSSIDSCTHFGYFFPRKWGLEWLSNKVVLETKISDVADHEGQKVASFSILSSGSKSFVLFGKGVNVFHLKIDLVSWPLEENGAESHLSGIKTHDLSDEIFFSCVDCLMKLVLVLCLEGHPESKLLIVHKPDAGRPHFGHRNYIMTLLPSYMNLMPASRSWNRIDS